MLTYDVEIPNRKNYYSLENQAPFPDNTNDAEKELEGQLISSTIDYNILIKRRI